MTSLKIVNNRLDALEHKDFSNLFVIEISKKELNQIKQDLEILKLIIKWKNNIYLRYDFEYLDNEESIVMQNELKLIENYLAHHLGYIPKCFKENIKSLKIGDSQ